MILNFLKKTCVITELEIRKVIHDPTEILTRSVQPALWLLVFGQVFAKMPMMAGRTNYISFMTPGILAQSVLFVSIFSGIAIIWEKDLGLIQKMLTTPTPRASIVLGKAISAGLRTLPILLIIYILAFILGVSVRWDLFSIAGVLSFVLLGSIFFSTFSLIIACLVKTRERFMGIGQLLTMPLFFASNAIYPIEIMPDWLKILSHVNPLTYVIDGLRTFMLGTPSAFNLGLDLGILFLSSCIAVSLGAILYKRVAM
ncbi:ABC transporter permease [Leptospira licerasiae]|uniref:Transport permease protein n=1 Tax=Leptospira licerasiae str. MMD4847 TaxID=1049971 RepID=A0ABP2R8X8_9LEPT|nr:ABC transporter permease [Leptospira licerasiae]EIE00886.1 daunorubicin resistance ABC transporter membrane protein [Leptospira licerasiae serovar Varillal str. VAR 010]EJZ40777.1 daunorubicin resistance ABC transporter membrane protein [Leptospira licerasiae str. MMD4847]TGM88590.1 multidrug ABC transporter permease [Leptospira licerasiae]